MKETLATCSHLPKKQKNTNTDKKIYRNTNTTYVGRGEVLLKIGEAGDALLQEVAFYQRGRSYHHLLFFAFVSPLFHLFHFSALLSEPFINLDDDSEAEEKGFTFSKLFINAE